MRIVLDGERLEAALVDVAGAGRVAMGVPTLRVREGQPAGEAGEVVFFSWPNDQMPMVGHHAIREQPHAGPLDRFFEDVLESCVVCVVVKNRHPRIGTVENVVY